MRSLIAFMFIAATATASDWIDGPKARANRGTEETQPRQTNPTQTGTTAKAGKEGGCVKCGPLCDCGSDCQCTADYWKDSCSAVPAAHRAAYYRSITPTYYVQPMTYYVQPSYMQSFGGSFGSGCSTGG